ncbi:hypothetical protein [Cyanobium sp. CH-040]|uniref:hypothetical protein n=1 Tax=Cyanobium sp. CH-040 TaxID=2823708 RepID=UPI0020CEF916|nr:hypothetical protein [Cyanobium sp. CH-040]MCP9928116.1 hypothetical protein [Cyanobium sp. CH-040]
MADATPPEATPGAASSAAELVRQLQADRLWLLRHIDSGAWPQWRLDLAALERELGELLDRVGEHPQAQD